MSLFVVRNGFSGSDPVGVVVDATDAADAAVQAKTALDALGRGPSYSERLTVATFAAPYVGEFV